MAYYGKSILQLHSLSALSALQRFQSIPERVLSGLSFFLIPITIGLISVIALSMWNDEYAAEPEMQLDLRVLPRADSFASLDRVRSELALKPSSVRYDNKLSESPVWFGFKTGQSSDSNKIVEFPSRHAVEMTCWDSDSKRQLGHSSSSDTHGQVGHVKAGFYLSLNNTGPEIICRTSFLGPGRLTARLWSPDDLEVSSHDFHRNSGLLDGGIVVLTLFVLAAALINREWLSLIFAA